ncbi:MAG: hypothetical protein LUF92_04625 [Clostridiales bacterium]|nr:hypothetical protein [Clostridiales bacterium]
MGYRKIILVGENNLCRSFMAETILRGLLKKKNISDIEVISHGMVVLFSEPVSQQAATVLKKRGYEIEDFRSSPLESADLESADLVLTMNEEQAEQVKADYDIQPTCTCMSIGTFTDLDDEVPMVGDDTEDAFEQCFHSIETLMEAVTDRIIGELLQ